MTSRPRPVRLAFDMRVAARNRTGTGRYARELARYLTNDPAVEFLPIEDKPTRVATSFPERAARAAGDLVWPQVGLPYHAARLHADIIHAPAFIAPLWGRSPTVVTVLDTIFHRCPADYPAWWAAYMNWVMPHVLGKARAVIAISAKTKSDLVSDFGVDADKIEVIHLAVDHSVFRPSCLPRPIAHPSNLRPGYVLSVGGLVRRKRIPLLLEAFAAIRADGRRQDLQLVIVGDASDGMAGAGEVTEAIRRLHMGSSVIMLGRVSDGLLPDLYRGAAVLVSASDYEGFGLTPLEAMACGTPVVARSGSAVDEVVGDAGILVGDGPAALSRALCRLLDDAPLRQHLRDKGLKRASQFTWEAVGRETVAVYRRARAGTSVE